MRATDLTPVGSKSTDIMINKEGNTVNKKTTSIFVASKRNVLKSIDQKISSLDETTTIAEQFSRIEKISNFIPSISSVNEKSSYYEAIIHLLQDRDTEFVKRKFILYAVI